MKTITKLKIKFHFWNIIQKICLFTLTDPWWMVAYYLMFGLIFANVFIWQKDIIFIYIVVVFGVYTIFIQFLMKKVIEKISSKLEEIISTIQIEQRKLDAYRRQPIQKGRKMLK